MIIYIYLFSFSDCHYQLFAQCLTWFWILKPITLQSSGSLLYLLSLRFYFLP